MTDFLQKLEDIQAKLALEKQPFLQVFNHPNLDLELYKPDKVDLQSPHTRDEVYIIQGGSGHFTLECQTVSVQTNDVIFVPAHAEHRFHDFTEDFATWVLFFGPEK